MKCTKCGAEMIDGSTVCNLCGTPKPDAKKEQPHILSKIIDAKTQKKSKKGMIFSVIIFLALAGIGAYGSLDDDAIDKNNEALTSYDSGDSETAIAQFQQAIDEASTDEVKVNTYINLAYVYTSELRYDEALDTFRKAIDYAKNDSFNYHLLSGEIALLEYNFASSLESFNKAYDLEPNDFQINNTLALFYLDLEDIAPEYVDYPQALVHAEKAFRYDFEKSEIIKQNLAIAHFFNDNFDDTISLLSSSNMTQHPYAAFWLGLAYLGDGDEVNAGINFQIAIDGGADIPEEVYEYL